MKKMEKNDLAWVILTILNAVVIIITMVMQIKQNQRFHDL
jgi:hypothetical protein